MSVGLSVIVHSYNRPRLIAEALRSIVRGQPEQIIIADDGSTFDIAGTAAACGADLVGAPPMSIEERLRVARQGALLNDALSRVTQEITVYLCDDDLHHPDWYEYLRQWFAAHPESNYVRGDWGAFADGDMLGDRMAVFPDQRRATSGNFAHRIGLVRECGAAWPLHHQVNLDDAFLRSLERAGANVNEPVTVGFAGWRREHPYLGVHYASSTRFHPEAARAVFNREWCE